MTNQTPLDIKATLASIEQQAAILHQQHNALYQSINTLFQKESFNRYQLIKINQKCQDINAQYPHVPLSDMVPSWVQQYLDDYDYAKAIRNALTTAWNQITAEIPVQLDPASPNIKMIGMHYCLQWDVPGITTIDTDIPLHANTEYNTINPVLITLTPTMLDTLAISMTVEGQSDDNNNAACQQYVNKETSRITWKNQLLEQAILNAISARFPANAAVKVDVAQAITKLNDALLTNLNNTTTTQPDFGPLTCHIPTLNAVLQLTHINQDTFVQLFEDYGARAERP